VQFLFHIVVPFSVPFAQEPRALLKTSSCLSESISFHFACRPLRATSARSLATLAPYPVRPRRLLQVCGGGSPCSGNAQRLIVERTIKVRRLRLPGLARQSVRRAAGTPLPKGSTKPLSSEDIRLFFSAAFLKKTPNLSRFTQESSQRRNAKPVEDNTTKKIPSAANRRSSSLR